MGGRAIEQSSLLSALFNQSVLSSNHDVARPALLVDDVIPKEEREPGDHPSAVGVVRSEEALGRLAVRAARLASEVRLRLAKGEAEAELVNELATHAVLLELAEAIGEDPHVLAQAMVEKLKP